jgi:acetyl-CoA carboxylase carboxyl transferase subunit alpha
MALEQSDTIQPLDFEKSILDMHIQIEELVRMSTETGVDFETEIQNLRVQAAEVNQKLYQHLSPAQKLQVARHPQRPNFLEWVTLLSPNTWIELHGDRAGADDRAILGGIAEVSLNELSLSETPASGHSSVQPEEASSLQPVMIIGMQKGRTMKENLIHNFGMASPEGYRKAMRLFAHAEKFRLPIITLIDTPGAYPGMQGEEHGIGHAIAHNIREMARLTVPVISIVTGEASSGGALGIGVSDRIYMLEHALYTVISPEGCASILWRSAAYASQAADALKITAQDLKTFGIIDDIIEEPIGGAHRDPVLTGQHMQALVQQGLRELLCLPVKQLREQRYQKYRKIGAFEENALIQ